MIKEIEDAIETKLKTVESDTFIDRAPFEAKDPYLVMSRPTGSSDWDSMKTYPKDVIQVAGYSRTKNTLRTLESSVRSLLDRKQTTFSLTNYYIVNISVSFETQGELDGVYFFIHQYKFDIEPK